MVDFTFEFRNEVQSLSRDQEERLRQEAEERLRHLSESHQDLIGAAVSLEHLTEGQVTPHLYQGRVVVYARPDNIAAVTKEADPTRAIKRTLDAIERQVREKRERLRARSRETSALGTYEGLYEMVPQEIYATYGRSRSPAEWLAQPRSEIAARLMVEENLSEGDAFYAADQIQVMAQEMTENPDIQSTP